jgi:hypothetical protein
MPYLVHNATGESVKTSAPSSVYTLTLQGPLPVARRLLPHGGSIDPQIFVKRQGEKVAVCVGVLDDACRPRPVSCVLPTALCSAAGRHCWCWTAGRPAD